MTGRIRLCWDNTVESSFVPTRTAASAPSYASPRSVHRLSPPAMAEAPARAATAVQLFDALCHLQDPRALTRRRGLRCRPLRGQRHLRGTPSAPTTPTIRSTSDAWLLLIDSSPTRCAQKDWHMVKRMAEDHLTTQSSSPASTFIHGKIPGLPLLLRC
jgi:hypothetical protein